MKFKPLKTSKLFYKKWPYKIECVQAGASRMYRNPNGTLHEWTATSGMWGRSQWTASDLDKLKLFHSKVKPFYEKDIQIRVEGRHFNIFCKDKTLLDEISKNLDQWIVSIHGPASDEELEYMMSNGHKKRVCNQLPKEKYKYKVYLKERMNLNTVETFGNWIKKYAGKITCPPSTQNWFDGNARWIQSPYIYVEDAPTLSMVGLFLGDNVRVVEEFILRSSINTSS